MEEKKRKKKAPSARARLTKSFGFGRKGESDSDSDGEPFAADVQTSWHTEVDSASADGCELVVADESASVPRKRSASSRSRRAGDDGATTPKSLKKSSKKKLSRKAGRDDGDAGDEEHARRHSPSSGEAGGTLLKDTKKGSSRELRTKGKAIGKELAGKGLGDASSSLATPKRSRSSSSSPQLSKGSKKRGPLSLSQGKARSSPLKGRKGRRGSGLKLSSSGEADDVAKQSSTATSAAQTHKEEVPERSAARTLTNGALDDQPVEFADERRRRHNPLKLRRSASLSKLMDGDEMAAMRGEAHARGLFASRDTVAASRGLTEEPEDDFDRPQPENTLLRSKSRSGWKNLLKRSQLSRLDLKKALQGRKSKSQSELSRSKVRKGDRSKDVSGSVPLPTMAYRKEADISSMDSLKLLLAGDERMPSFRRFLDATYSSENLAFIEIVTKFRQEEEEKRLCVAAEAMKTFIGSSAPQELNLDVREVRKLEERWEGLEGDPTAPVPLDLFDAAYDSVFSLLYYDLYMRYIVSKTFADFEAGLET